MIKDLERFISIVNTGSITKAAKSLFLTQPALSLSLIRLEKEINTQLFLRRKKQLILTKKGEYFYRTAIKIIDLWENAKKDQDKYQEIPVSIGLIDSAALLLVPFLKKKFSSSNTIFEIKIDKSSLLINDVEKEILDICICVINPNESLSKNILLIKKFNEQLYPVSNKKYKSNSNMSYITYNKDSLTRKYIDNIFLKHEIKPNILVESTSMSFMKELALNGSGIALLPKNFIKDELSRKELVVQKLDFNFFRSVGLFINKNKKTKKINNILEEIKEKIPEEISLL